MGNKSYEESFATLKNISEDLKQGNLSVDQIVEKASKAKLEAKNCLDILKKERGSFKTIEEELENISKDVQNLIDDGD